MITINYVQNLLEASGILGVANNDIKDLLEASAILSNPDNLGAEQSEAGMIHYHVQNGARCSRSFYQFF